MRNKILTVLVVAVVIVAAFFAYNYAQDKPEPAPVVENQYAFFQDKPATFPEELSLDERMIEAKEYWEDDKGRQGALFATGRPVQAALAYYEEVVLANGWEVTNKNLTEDGNATMFIVKGPESAMIDFMVINTPKGDITQINIKYIH
jgi:hypothetical protein